MQQPDCNAACIKVIIDAGAAARTASEQLEHAALLAWSDPTMRGRMTLSPADATEFSAAADAFTAAARKARAMVGFPVI